MTEQRQHVDMKQAVDIALKAIRGLYPEATLEDLLLEEVLLGGEYTDDKWQVTLGFARPYSTERPGALGNVLPQTKPRAYKRFLIDAETGEVQGMVDGLIDVD